MYDTAVFVLFLFLCGTISYRFTTRFGLLFGPCTTRWGFVEPIPYMIVNQSVSVGVDSTGQDRIGRGEEGKPVTFDIFFVFSALFIPTNGMLCMLHFIFNV